MPDPAVMNGALRHFRRTERRRLYHLLGDRELLARFLTDRDEAAFEEVVTRHGPMVRAVCRRVLGPSADADDAFQAAFLVLLRRARSIRRTDLLAGWLCAVAYRTARQALRRRSRLGARERLMDELPEPARPDDPPKDWLPLFDAALQRLPARYRDPVVLCELQGLSRRDASVRLGLTEGTLSSRLGRARDLLRRKLAPHGFPLAVGSALAPSVVPEALTASTAAAAVHVSAESVTAVVLTEGVLTAMLASKLKAGALAGTAMLAVGLVAGLQFTGPASGAGGPPGKDPSPSKEAAKESPKAAAANPDSKPDRLPAEYEPFQGQWVVTAAEGDGTAQSPHAIGVDENWTFTGSKLTTGGDAKADATEAFTLDPKAKPPTIDFTLTQFSPEGTGALVRRAYKGIYRFEADGRLVICYRRSAHDILRPTRFITARNSGAVVVSLRRPEVKAPRAAEAVVVQSEDQFPAKVVRFNSQPAVSAEKDADLGKVVGAWELTDVDGQSPDALVGKLNAQPQPAGAQRPKQRWESLRRLQLLPASGPTDLVNQPGAQSYVAYVELDGTRNPKWFTLFATERSQPAGPEYPAVTAAIRLCGIYKLDGEKLVVCLPQAEGPPLLRPTDFAGDGEGGLYLLTYQRASKTWKPEAKVAPNPVPAAGPGFDVPPGVISPPGISDLPLPAPTITPPTAVGPAAPGVVPTDIPTPNIPAAGRLPAPPTGGPLPAIDSAPSPAAERGPGPDVFIPEPEPKAALPSPTSDLDRLQGTWVMAQVDGRPTTPDEQRQAALEFVRDRVLTPDGKYARVELKESGDRRLIAILPGKDGGTPTTGIYRLDGDRLTIASSNKSPKLVPLRFEADPDAGITVEVFERPKSPPAVAPKDSPKVDPASKAPARDLQKEVEELRVQVRKLEQMLREKK